MAKRWITRGGIGQPGLGQTRQYVVSDGVAREGIMSLKQQREWLKRSRLWPMMQINNYVPKRVLGAGAHGIVGVWELKGRSQVLPKLIVVKQVRVDSNGEQLEVEAKLLRDLVATDTHHVVRLYKGYHEESGSGSSEQSDPLPFDANAQWDPTLLVARLYMEYCQYGSMESAMEKIFNDPDAVIPEDFIWRVLHCLASGLVVLKHGNESSNDNSPTWKKAMAHFDLKPANILMSAHDDEHPRLPIFKFADFGLSLPLPKSMRTMTMWNARPQAYRDNWQDDATWRSTPGYTPPEQIWVQLDGGRIGLCSDVWNVGAILYELMTGKIFQTATDIMVQQGNNNVPALQFRQYRFLANSADPAQPPFTTFGHDILQRPYSKRLINLTHQCLAMDPQLRPTPRALLRTVEGMMQNVYQQPPRSVQKTLLNREGGSSASPFNHALLARLTAAEVNAYPNPTSTADDQPPQRNPNWPVPGEDRNIPLAPFVYPANPLKRIRDLNHYPWRDTVQDEGFQPLNVQTRHGNRVSRRLRRRETGM